MPRSSATTIPAVRKSVSGNLLYNGNFEYLPASNTPMTSAGGTFIDGTATGSSTNTYGWYVYNYSGTRSAQFDTTTSYSGNGSLKLTTNAGSIGVNLHAATTNHSSWSINNLPAEPNTSYTISCWVKTNYISGNATTGVQVTLSERSSNNSSAGGGITVVTGLKTSQDWTYYTSNLTTGTTTRFIQPNFAIVGNNGTATLNMEAWFDNISITKTTPDTRSTTTVPRRSVENLVFNGDFEYAPPFTAATNTTQRFIDGTASGSANNYSPYVWGFIKGNTATAQFDSTVSKFGTTSMKITTGSSAAYGEVNLYGPFVPATTKNAYIPALPNTTYTISWWMKTEYVSGDASQGATVALIEYNGVPTSTAFNSSGAATIKTTTDWTFYSYSITTQSATRFFNVQARIYGHNGTGTLQMNAWFDDIRLTKTTPDTRTTA